jgi:phosphoglycerol transferase MdoB-like AlkP superfamily enzyme
MNLSKTKIAALSLTALVIGLLAFGNVAIGQVANIPGVDRIGPSTVGGVVDIIRQVVRWVYIIFFIIAVLLIIFAAFTYLTAGGDPEKVAEAKNRLIYAAVAIAVAFLAVGFEVIVRNFLTTPGA